MSRHRPCFEPLESRLLLSGNVTASVIGGTLYITGDDLNNDIVISATNQDQFKVQSGANTTTINYVAGPLTFSGVTGNVQIALNGGDDRLVVNSSQNARDFNISGGPGNNNISFAAFVVNPENVTITNGDGNNTVTLDSFNKLGNVFISNGNGTNSTTISSGTTLSGNVTIIGGSGTDTVAVDSIVTWNGGLTVMSGTGASDVEITNSTITGGVSVFASGGGTLSSGPYAGYASVFRVANTCAIGGAINVFNGPGPNTVGLNSSIIHSVFIMNGSGAAYAGLSNTVLTGTFTFLRGDGGSLLAPLAGYASQVNMDHSTITGGIMIFNGAGVDTSSFQTCTLGGSLLVSNGPGPSGLGLDTTTVAGGVTHMSSGGGGYLPQSGTLTTITMFTNNCEIGGDVNCFMGAGTDEDIFSTCTVHGNVLISNGPDAAAGGGSGNTFQKSFIFLRGDGGTIGSTSDFASDLEFDTSTFGAVTIINGSGNNAVGFSGGSLASLFVSSGAGTSVLFLSNAPVAGNVTHFAPGGGHTTLPPYADYTTYTSISNTSTTGDIGGDVTVFGGVGNDFLNITKVNVEGRVFLAAGGDGVLLVTSGEIIKGGITVLRGDGGNLAAENGYASYVSMTNTVVLSGMTFLNGSGTDGLYMTNVGGVGLLVLDGPGGAAVDASNLVLSGSLTVIRGDGGTIPAVPGYASYEQYTGGTEVHGAFIMNGAGKDLVSLDSVNFHGYTTILNGAGDQVVGVTSSTTATDMGSLSISGAGGIAQISIGDASGVYTDIGDLSISTGDSNDAITFRRFGLFGNTSLNTGGGDDTVAIDDGTFIGAVDITTGPAYIASGTDNDTVNIERITGTSDDVTFAQLLRVNGGAGNDFVRIGVHGDANAYAHFHLGFQIDGGGGSNSLNYWTGGNVFDAGAVQTWTNFAVVS